VEAQKTPNSQGSAEPKEQSWWHHNTWLQTTLELQQ
jgi:hypothetical protein